MLYGTSHFINTAPAVCGDVLTSCCCVCLIDPSWEPARVDRSQVAEKKFSNNMKRWEGQMKKVQVKVQKGVQGKYQWENVIVVFVVVVVVVDVLADAVLIIAVLLMLFFLFFQILLTWYARPGHYDREWQPCEMALTRARSVPFQPRAPLFLSCHSSF